MCYGKSVRNSHSRVTRTAIPTLKSRNHGMPAAPAK